MTPETIIKERSNDILHSNHQEWLRHPVTHEVKKVIDLRLNNIIDSLTAKSLDRDLPDTMLRAYAAQLKIVKQLKHELYDTETFINTIRTISK